jgi:hypothetical protein
MQGSTFSRIGIPRILSALLASSAVFSVGCSNMLTTAPSLNALDAPATIGGKLHGGNQPVSGATVNIWFAGQGSTPATIGATTHTSSDGTGSFSFVKSPSIGLAANGTTFSCPATDTLVYVVATGGNTLNSGDSSANNSAAVFLAPFGPCGAINSSSFVYMSEVTTVATMAALQQYFDPAPSKESFATDGTGLSKTAITNAFALIPNLVNLATGQAVVTKAIAAGSLTAGVGYSGTSVIATPESAKVNLIANILASCVNNISATAANCTTLFANAVPPDPTVTSRPYGTTFVAATDVLQATYYILTNPTSGYVIDGTTLANTHMTNLFNLQAGIGAPFQSTLSVVPSDWTIAISYASASRCGTGNGHLINSAQDLAVDIYGGVWLANNEVGTGNLSQLSSNGVPATCIAVGSGSNSSVTIDQVTSGLANIWVADAGSSSVYRYKPGTSTVLSFPTPGVPQAIAANGAGDIFYTTPSAGTLSEIPNGANAGVAVAPMTISSSVGAAPAHVMVDNTPAIWTTSGANFITRTASTTPSTGAGYSSFNVTQAYPSYGLSVTAKNAGGTSNFVYTSSQDGSAMTLDQGLGITYGSSSVSGWPVTHLSAPTAVATDGAQNVWSINNASGANSVFAAGYNLQTISPVTGFQKSATYLGSGRSIVIDQSGNVWIGLDGANSITQIVGAAVPVWQPYANGLFVNHFQVIP